MKALIKVFYGCCIIIILICSVILFFAFHPNVSAKISDYLNRNTIEQVETEESKEIESESIESIESEEESLTEESMEPIVEPTIVKPSFVPEVTSLYISLDKVYYQIESYVRPREATMQTPSNVANKMGAVTVLDTNQQLTDTELTALKPSLSVGDVGLNLTFQESFYPYYYMLNDTLKGMYRQIYANAMGLTSKFQPYVVVNTSQLKIVFEAVLNDHPELFWLEPSYTCKYSTAGVCIELTLDFNSTSSNLQESKTKFERRANEIVENARYLLDDYEREVFVHRELLKKTTYNASAAMNQSAYSAMVEGQTVCAGYARAFQYIMQQLGIPCYYVSGYAGENHAWNIINLYGEYYNVDLAWNDTEPNTFDYFNKTDEDFSHTHARRSLSVNLPACKGNTYRNLETTQSDISQELASYYADCYERIINNGLGTISFSVLVNYDLWLEIEEAYENGVYKDGYLMQSINLLNARTSNVEMQATEQEKGGYLLNHIIRIFR